MMLSRRRGVISRAAGEPPVPPESPILGTDNVPASDTTTYSSMTLDRPEDAAEGDRLLAFILALDAEVTAPSGWTLVESSDVAGGPFLHCFTRTVDETPPDDYTFTFASAVRGTAVMVAVTPCDVDDSAMTTVRNVNFTQREAPSVDAAANDSLLLCAWAGGTTQSSRYGHWDAHPTMDVLHRSLPQSEVDPARILLMVAWEFVDSGATGTRLATRSNDSGFGNINRWAEMSVVLS